MLFFLNIEKIINPKMLRTKPITPINNIHKKGDKYSNALNI